MSFEISSGAAIPESLLTQSRSNAAAVGYATGWSQGMHDARVQQLDEVHESERRVAEVTSRHEASLRSAVRALNTGAEQLEAAATPVIDELAHTVLSAAVAIAESLLGIELRSPQARSTAALARVFALCCDDAPISIRLHPDDIAAIEAGGGLARLTSPMANRAIMIESDPSLAPGDAMAISGATTIDARLDSAVHRLQSHLAR